MWTVWSAKFSQILSMMTRLIIGPTWSRRQDSWKDIWISNSNFKKGKKSSTLSRTSCLNHSGRLRKYRNKRIFSQWFRSWKLRSSAKIFWLNAITKPMISLITARVSIGFLAIYRTTKRLRETWLRKFLSFR